MAIIHIIYSKKSILNGLYQRWHTTTMPAEQVVKEVAYLRSEGHNVFLVEWK